MMRIVTPAPPFCEFVMTKEITINKGLSNPVLAPRLGNENEFIFVSLALRRQ